MRRQIKYPNSKIVSQGLSYSLNNSASNRRIAHLLGEEQKNFCAYTDECLKGTEPGEIDHFNPQLKGTPNDGYNNWFLIKHQWNIKKGNKWYGDQVVLHPTSDDFEKRIIYIDGDYTASSSDIEANNLIKLLDLDNPILASERKRYIARRHADLEAYGQDKLTYFSILLEKDKCNVNYPRAIREKFGVDILQMIK